MLSKCAIKADWSLGEILNARLTKSPEKVQEVLDVLTPLYEAWMALSPREPVPVLRVAQRFGHSFSQAVSY